MGASETLDSSQTQADLVTLRQHVSDNDLADILNSLPSLSQVTILKQKIYASFYPYVVLFGTLHGGPQIWIGLRGLPISSRADEAPSVYACKGHPDAGITSVKIKKLDVLDDVDMVEPFKTLWFGAKKDKEMRSERAWTQDARGMVKSLAYWYFVNHAVETGRRFRVQKAIKGYFAKALRTMAK